MRIRSRGKFPGGRLLPAAGGRRDRAVIVVLAPFRGIDNVVAIKIAPFNRYRTLDVVRGVVAAGAQERVMPIPATTITSSSIS